MSKLLSSSIFFVLLSAAGAQSQSAPDCKSFYPEFRNATELSRMPGSALSKEGYEERLKIFQKPPPKIPTKEEAKKALEQLASPEIQESIRKGNEEIKRLQAIQANAEVAMAGALNLQAGDGTRVSLYCYAASSREQSINEQNQIRWMFDLMLKMAAWINQYAK